MATATMIVRPRLIRSANLLDSVSMFPLPSIRELFVVARGRG